MNVLLRLVCCLLVLMPFSAQASEDKVKTLRGISVVGNREAPKALFLVPWKNSELGIGSSLTSGLLDEGMQPVDKEVFMRELDFYEFSHANQSRATVD